MKQNSRMITAVTVLVVCSSGLLYSQSRTETEKVYNGFFRGQNCSATLRWVTAGTEVEVSGSVQVGAVTQRLSGESYTDEALILFVENEPTKHSLAKSEVGGKTNWVGDLLSLTETGSKVVTMSPVEETRPTAAPGIETPSQPTMPATPGTTSPAPGGGLPPLPTMPATGGTTSPTPGGGLPPLPTMPATGGTTAPATGGGLPPLPTTPGTGADNPSMSRPGMLPGVGISPPGGPAISQQPEELFIDPEVWPVGKWPEGMTHDGNHLWVAESGQRTLAQINESSGAIIERVSSGRLPVGMATNVETGDVFAEVVTDKTIIKYSRAAKGGKFVDLPDYPEGISVDDKAVWVLVYIDGSNESGQVIRYDQRNLAMTKSELIGFGICEMVKKSDWLWVNQLVEVGTELHLLDPTSLRHEETISLAGSLMSIAASDNSVVLGGGVGENDGLVSRIDPYLREETGRRTFPGEFINIVAATNDFVVAAGDRGTLWVMAFDDLTLLRTIHLNRGEFRPSSLMIDGEILYITTHVGDGENGSILVVKDWAPEMGHP